MAGLRCSLYREDASRGTEHKAQTAKPGAATLDTLNGIGCARFGCLLGDIMILVSKLRTAFGAALVAAGLGGALPAHAVTLGVGDVVRIDFDLTATSVAPSYAAISYGLNFGDILTSPAAQPLDDILDSGDSLSVEWFAPDGTSLLTSPRTIGLAPGFFTTGISAADSFSATALTGAAGYALITIVTGAVDLTEARVRLISGGQFTGTQIATITPLSAVPLPAGGLLLLTALSGAGLMARRRRSRPA